VFEAYVFNKIKQEEGESIDQFLIIDRLQTKNCNFGQQENKMVREKIVIGISSEKMREKLLSTANASSENVIATCRESEIASRQAAEINEKEIKEMDMLANWRKKPNINKSDEIFYCKGV